MLWGEQGVLNTTLDERLGFWPEADAWRYAFAGVKIGPPREQFERAPALVGLAADQAILALYEGVARTREGGLVWATTHSPIADLVTARLLETIKGAEEPQWLHKPFGSGAFALFHLVGENRTPRALRFVNP